MNQWKTPKFQYPDQPMDRGKVLWEEDLERMAGEWKRYADVDGDGIPFRTLMGNRHPAAAYFTRGTGHTEEAKYSEEPENWERILLRIRKKFETARTLMPKPILHSMPGARVGFLAYGSTDPAVQEARHLLEQQGIKTNYLQVRAVPFTDEVREFVKGHDRIYVVELNRDGQMQQLLTLAYPEMATKLVSLAHLDGMPLTAKWIVNAYSAKEVK
jgi:2-oxoglutarate ferredoxin oxidoreductase subunit alpha